MQDFEKFGMFYLGKYVDPATGKLENKPLLYDSKDLTTHAVCVGMTGSGKTGLGITLLEEAVLDKIPAIAIDPKGDLGNLLLTFPDLSPKEFEPWVDDADAERKNMDKGSYSEYIAKTWKDGLASWEEGPERIKNLKKSAEFAIYTPASRAGIPLSILSSFSAPSDELMLDPIATQDKASSLASSLLELLGIDSDPIKSKEHILISTLIQQGWQDKTNLDIASLVQLVQKPPFNKIGALDLETFYSAKERKALSIALNNLLASTRFQAWTEGEPLDIKKLLHTDKGKPKLSIISIAHLQDSDRMFFVTLLLNEILAWARLQPGTSSLRAILYMDEIFGFFPPTAMPPSKLPMLTLLKQARAYGLGIVLATQNPVDLDYKGLSNCGTWFIGKLQTERDKLRLLDGLKTASRENVDDQTIDQLLAMTGNRTFIMRSVHEKKPVLFQTRWTMSYLRGPLTLAQIAKLSPSKSTVDTKMINAPADTSNKDTHNLTTKPAIPLEISEYYKEPNASLKLPYHYYPRIAGFAQLHFVDPKNKIDTWQEVLLICRLDEDGKSVLWDEGENILNLKEELKKTPAEGATYAELPAILMQEKTYTSFAKEFSAFLYQKQTLKIFQTAAPNITSKADESEGDFRARVVHEMHEQRDELVAKLRGKYEAKQSALNTKLQRAEQKLADRQEKAWMQKLQTFISFLTTLVTAFFSRGVTKDTISQTGTSLRRATRMNKDSQSASQAEDTVATYQEQIEQLEAEMNDEIASLIVKNGQDLEITTIDLRPRKSDISVEKIALVWWPK